MLRHPFGLFRILNIHKQLLREELRNIHNRPNNVWLTCEPDLGTALVFGILLCKSKGKVFPYSLPSVGPGADLGVQAVSLQVT